MAFGFTRQRHFETVTAQQEMASWALAQARKAKDAGRCDLVRDYGFSAYEAAARMSSHVVSQNVSRKREHAALELVAEYKRMARRLIESCIGGK